MSTNKPKHTPGPWKHEIISDNYGTGCFISSEKRDTIAEIYAVKDTAGLEGEANAALIAAAPEMLEALKAVAKAYGFKNGEGDHTADFVIRTITKAEWRGEYE
jgi:hypothetical protein